MTLDEFANLVGSRLHVAEIDGVLWASDSYWIAPYADSLAARLLHFWNLDGPGTYDLEPLDDYDWPRPITARDVGANRAGDVAERTVQAMARHIATEATVPLSPAVVAAGRHSHHILIRDGAGRLSSVLTRPDGQHVMLDPELLRVVAGDDWAKLPIRQVDEPSSLDSVLRPVRCGGGIVTPIRESWNPA